MVKDMTLRLGEPVVGEGWLKGRTIVLERASVITMGPVGDLVGDVVIRDDGIVACRRLVTPARFTERSQAPHAPERDGSGLMRWIP